MAAQVAFLVHNLVGSILPIPHGLFGDDNDGDI